MEYVSKLNLIETEQAIKFIKDTFEKKLAEELFLMRVSAPLFVLKSSGLNDDLSGEERPVDFDILQTGETAEVVHSLAKWKRHALGHYNIGVHSGLYTDMNAIRRDEVCDATHSLYVDQWDWEKVINPEDRNIEYLQRTVRQIYSVIRKVTLGVRQRYPQLSTELPGEIYFTTAQQLEDEYPNLKPEERENEICKKHGAVFITAIGHALKSGKPHSMRAADYDDWDLNGDILVWFPTLGRAMELSSMGIRVDKDALAAQLKTAGQEDRLNLPFHKALMNDELPLTIGGGIGQSRMCMMMLEKAHVGEVQASVWPQEMLEECRKNNIFLL